MILTWSKSYYLITNQHILMTSTYDNFHTVEREKRRMMDKKKKKKNLSSGPRSSKKVMKVVNDFRHIGSRRDKAVEQKEKMHAMALMIVERGWETPIHTMFLHLNWSNQDAVDDVCERMERYFVSKSRSSGYQTDPTVLATALQWFVFRLEVRGNLRVSLQSQLDSVLKSDSVNLMLMFNQWWPIVEE